MLRVLDLFSGIGGFSLGLERTGGFETVAFCEIEDFPRKVLAKHWPNVPCYRDVRELTGERLAADGIAIDAICGGFPCQDISESNVRGAGIDGERSGLWAEYARLIGELRPRYVIVENTSNLLGRGMHRVLGDLAARRYDAEWHGIPAAALGAAHERDRQWIVAYPAESHGRPLLEQSDIQRANCILSQREEGAGRPQMGASPSWLQSWPEVADAVRGMDDGLPLRMDGHNGCANAVVPHIPEMIGRAILDRLAA